MRVIVVGGTGTIGKAVVQELGLRHTVIVAGHGSGDLRVDINNFQSIEKMYKDIGHFDAMVSTVGKVYFGEFVQMTPKDFFLGLNDKLMGQVNLVIAGLNHINDHGSFSLTSGVLSHDPVRYGSSASMVNAAIDGFVIGAAIEMPRGIRINAISPTVLAESMNVYGDYFRGYEPVSAARVAKAFSKSVEGAQTGQVYKVGGNG